MRAIIIDDKDGQALLDKLELAKFTKSHMAPQPSQATLDAVHRHFHFHVVSWLQEHGWQLKR